MLQALGMEDSISSILGGGGGSSEPAPAEPPAEESVKEALRINLLEAENMLLRDGREATAERIQAVAAVPKEARKKLVESWPAKATQITESRTRPSISPPAKTSTSSAADRARAKWYSN